MECKQILTFKIYLSYSPSGLGMKWLMGRMFLLQTAMTNLSIRFRVSRARIAGTMSGKTDSRR